MACDQTPPLESCDETDFETLEPPTATTCGEEPFAVPVPKCEPPAPRPVDPCPVPVTPIEKNPCSGESDVLPSPIPTNPLVPAPTETEFDSILEWNGVMLEANANDYLLPQAEQAGPILTSRAFAIVSAAMYDAYNSIEKIGEEYFVTAPFTRDANSDAAVAQAAYQTLVELFPSQKQFFDAELYENLARIEDGASEDLGRAIGAWVAERILCERSNDRFDEVLIGEYIPLDLPGFHDVDPINPGQGFYAPGAMVMTPFAVESLNQFQTRLDDGTPESRIEFLKSDKYLDAYNEVKQFGGDGVNTATLRNEEQTEIGIFWAYDGRPGLGTPPRLYNQAVREVAEQQGNTEAENARLFALVNLAMADAGLTSWNTKYDDAFWRPVLGVREGDADANPETVGDKSWTPLGAPASNPRPGERDFSPAFPAYTSGHATFGAAAFQTLERFYGRDDISFRFVSDELNGVTLGSDGKVRPLAEREFATFSEAKWENAQSRIYLGIHWSFDAIDGVAKGDAVADFVFDNYLRPHDHREFDPKMPGALYLV